MLVVGSVLIAVAVGLMLWTGLGPGPLDVFIGAVRVRTGLPLGMTVWLVIGSLIALAWLLGRRPGPGTVVAPLLIGPVMQVVVDLLDTVDVPSALLVRIGIHLAAIAAIGVGAGALIVSGLGAGSGELLAIAASDRTGAPEPRMRLGCESMLLLVGMVLGGPVGLGTVLVAITIGPAVGHGSRLVGRITERTHLGTVGTVAISTVPEPAGRAALV